MKTESYLGDAEKCGLDPPVMEFVHNLRALLDDLQPNGISPSSTGVRAERGAADLVIGHKLLTGLGLVAAVGNTSATVYWASYSTLNRSDQFDAALDDSTRIMGRFEGNGFADAAFNLVRDELVHRLRLRGGVRDDRLSALEAYLADREASPVWRHRFQPRWKALLKRGDQESVDLSMPFMDAPPQLVDLLGTVNVH